jgi:16S rRNA (adenine1518-N6/adenine1519-N6)-dimethyltransferase
LNYNSPSSIRTFLEERRLSAHKKFGQHFLINEEARNKLAEALAIRAGAPVWEIGPGLGAMTRLLLDRKARVTAFEIDHGFIGALREIFAPEIAEKRLTIVSGDVVKTWKTLEAAPAGEPPYLLGNLPYNIAGMLLADFIEGGRFFARAAVTVQKEVAARIVARRGEAGYSSLAVLFSLFYHVETICAMNGGFFYPPPRVDSAGFCFHPKDNAPRIAPDFFPLVRALFSQRRKTVYNNLCRFAAEQPAGGAARAPRAALCEAALSACGIAKNTRAEQLEPSDFKAIADFLASASV